MTAGALFVKVAGGKCLVAARDLHELALEVLGLSQVHSEQGQLLVRRAEITSQFQFEARDGADRLYRQFGFGRIKCGVTTVGKANSDNPVAIIDKHVPALAADRVLHWIWNDLADD